MRLPTIFRVLTRRKVKLAIFSGLTGLCLITTVIMASQVFLRLHEYASASKDNMPWAVSRLEVAQLKLLDAIQSIDPALPESVDAVRRRFDAFYSRRDMLYQGSVYRDLFEAEDARADFELLMSRTEEIGVIIDSGPVTILARRDELYRRTSDLSGPIQELAKHGIARSAVVTENERRALSSKLVQVTVLSLLLLAALLSLTVFLWQLYRLYKRRALENRSTLNRLSTILNTSQDAVLVVCADGCIIDTNKAAHRMFFGGAAPEGRQPVQHILMRKQDDGGLHPVDGRQLLASCAKGPNLCANLMARDPEGGLFPVELSNDRAMRGGQPVVVCFIRDIARRMADQAELLAARDKALSGERAKARFLGMISHEMRTPLNGVIGTLDLLEQTDLTPDQARYVQIMQSSGQVLMSQIDDALELAQADQGRLTLVDEPFDLDALVAQLVQVQRPLAVQRGNRLTRVSAPGSLGWVRGDGTRVQQILQNLVSNAIKFTTDGDITVEIVRLDGDGDLVEIQVSDTGIGIESGDQARIFDDFVRVEDGADSAVEGTGLGLGVVRHLTRLMGGRAGVESEPGEGSLFWVRLPLPRCDAQLTPDETQPSGSPPLPAQDILIVEDNPVNRTVLNDMLRRDGHRVWQASNGAEGEEMAATRRFDVIIMDINMPVMDGIEAAGRIRAGGGASAGSRIVALTAYFNPETDGRLSRAGLDEVLTKPLRLTALRAVLAGKRSQAVPVPEADGARLLDAHTLEQLRVALSGERVRALCDGFRREGHGLMSDLPALRQGPADALADRLHAFAGLAATVGAAALRAQLNRAEAALRAGKPAQADAVLDGLPALWDSTLLGLDDSLRKAA